MTEKSLHETLHEVADLLCRQPVAIQAILDQIPRNATLPLWTAVRLPFLPEPVRCTVDLTHEQIDQHFREFNQLEFRVQMAGSTVQYFPAVVGHRDGRPALIAVCGANGLWLTGPKAGLDIQDRKDATTAHDPDAVPLHQRIYTIYERPLDHPEHFVVRRQDISEGTLYSDDTPAYLSLWDSLEDARTAIPTGFGSTPDPQVNVVEVWMHPRLLSLVLAQKGMEVSGTITQRNGQHQWTERFSGQLPSQPH